jgi:hypothetical protein
VLTTDKAKYSDGEFITISGMVSALGDPTILIGIYDQNDFPTGFYTPEIDSNLEFSTSFLAKSGINFKTFGAYYTKAYYGESEEMADFEFAKPAPVNNQNEQNPAPKPQPQVPQSVPKQETKPVEYKPQ